MLRITIRVFDDHICLFVEGRLSGACVSELEKCWQGAVAGQSPFPTLVDLTNVSFIDTNGKQLLSQMHEHGIKLVASGLMSKFIINEIEHQGFEHKRIAN